MSKVTVVDEYDNEGRLVKRTTTTEPEPTPWYIQPYWWSEPYRVTCGSGIVTSDKTIKYATVN